MFSQEIPVSFPQVFRLCGARWVLDARMHMMGCQRSPTSTPGDHQSLLQQISSRMSSDEITGALCDQAVWTPDVGTHTRWLALSLPVSLHGPNASVLVIFSSRYFALWSALVPPCRGSTGQQLCFWSQHASCRRLCIRTPPTQCLMCESCLASAALCTLLFTAFTPKDTDHVVRHG